MGGVYSTSSGGGGGGAASGWSNVLYAVANIPAATSGNVAQTMLFSGTNTVPTGANQNYFGPRPHWADKELRLIAHLWSNNVAAGKDLQFDLRKVNVTAGGAVAHGGTLGAAVAGSALVTTPPVYTVANTGTDAVMGIAGAGRFAASLLEADQLYVPCVMVVGAGSTAANSQVRCQVFIEVGSD